MSPLDLAQEETADVNRPLSVRLAQDDEVQLVKARDRRAHARRGADELDWLRLIRVTGGTGFSATLIDLSEGGALLEVDAPLRPGARLMLEISGTGLDASVPVQIIRSYVASLRDGATFYRGACAFDYHIVLPGEGAAATQPIASSDGFVGTDAALTYLFERCAGGDSTHGSAATPQVTLEREELLHVLGSIHARGMKDSRDAGTRFVVELLGAILPALQSGATRNAVMAALESRLHAWPSSLQSRLQSTRIRLASLIDRCALAGMVAGPPSPAESLFAAAADEPEMPPEVTAQENTFQRIVVRYLDGGIVKGFTQDFHRSRPQFSLWPTLNAKPAERVVVPLSNLKAVFFVRNFNGNPARPDLKTFSTRGQGRRLEVTFMDTEVILGTTLSYRPDAQGFFVIPADTGGNNMRVFVVCSAIRRVRFL